MLPATSSPPHLIVFSTLLFLLSSSSSIPPPMPSSAALAFFVSYRLPHVTLPLSSVVYHQPSFIRVLLTVVCSSPVSLSRSSALPSLPLTAPFFSCLPSLLMLVFVPSCFRTLVVVVVRSLPSFPFRIGKPVSRARSSPVPGVVAYFRHGYAAVQ